MPEYTYVDVIIDPNDPRVEIGKEYYFGDKLAELLKDARKDNEAYSLVEIRKDSDEPFVFASFGYSCIIRKKEPEKKYRPFDLNNEEDRARLRGAWIKYKCAPRYEYQITAVHTDRIFMYGDDKTPEDLLEDCLFLDGTPCGQEVTE